MLTTIAAILLRALIVVPIMWPPVRTLVEVQDEAIERLLDSDFTLCGDADFHARLDKIRERRRERLRQGEKATRHR